MEMGLSNEYQRQKVAFVAHLALVQKMTNCDPRELHEDGPLEISAYGK